MTILSTLRDLLAPFHAMSYTDYLRTDAWRRRRDRAIKRAGGRCQFCNSAQRLEVHHRTYERLGREANGDLTVLCHDCHEWFHQKRKVKR